MASYVQSLTYVLRLVSCCFTFNPPDAPAAPHVPDLTPRSTTTTTTTTKTPRQLNTSYRKLKKLSYTSSASGKGRENSTKSNSCKGKGKGRGKQKTQSYPLPTADAYNQTGLNNISSAPGSSSAAAVVVGMGTPRIANRSSYSPSSIPYSPSEQKLPVRPGYMAWWEADVLRGSVEAFADKKKQIVP